MGNKLYKVDPKTGEVATLKRTCPRCEKGTFMAEHFDRFACGRCGYTEFKRKGTKQNTD
ncbi:MAG: 30S ribosomal protein S27ae [Candidatus Thorarchaeota archaeon]|nr:MAG: 30S ribosomal protein S27ae [Candidatus Thorarchaeota archaeon]